jgi:hypothetical protein
MFVRNVSGALLPQRTRAAAASSIIPNSFGGLPVDDAPHQINIQGSAARCTTNPDARARIFIARDFLIAQRDDATARTTLGPQGRP